jgi:hypothetical protein
MFGPYAYERKAFLIVFKEEFVLFLGGSNDGVVPYANESFDENRGGYADKLVYV